MGRIAAHTQEQVFEAADKLTADGREVTPNTLRQALGSGSFTTLGAGIAAWRDARKTAPAPMIIDMPESVTAAFAQCWQAAAAEAGKEIASIRQKADAEINGTKRDLAEALAEIARLEGESHSDATALESARDSLVQAAKDAQQAATDAAAREAALAATAKQLQQQVEAQQAELARVHAETDAARKQHAAEAARLTDDYSRHLALLAEDLKLAQRDSDGVRVLHTEAATAKAEVERLASLCKTQDADLTVSRREARTASDGLARAQGELEALRSQLAILNDTVRGLAAPERKGQESRA